MGLPYWGQIINSLLHNLCAYAWPKWPKIYIFGLTNLKNNLRKVGGKVEVGLDTLRDPLINNLRKVGGKVDVGLDTLSTCFLYPHRWKMEKQLHVTCQNGIEMIFMVFWACQKSKNSRILVKFNPIFVQKLSNIPIIHILHDWIILDGFLASIRMNEVNQSDYQTLMAWGIGRLRSWNFQMCAKICQK